MMGISKKKWNGSSGSERGSETDLIPFIDIKKHFKLGAKNNMHNLLLEYAKIRNIRKRQS